MSDSILHYTLGLFTAYSSAIYTLTFLVGVWLAARYGRATLWLSLLGIAAAFYIRNGAGPLSFVGVTAMVVVHVTGGALIGLWLRRKKSFNPQSG